MANLAEHLTAELENMEGLLSRVPDAESLPGLSELELAGVAAMVHSYYNGVENLLKQVLRSQNRPLPTGESWHRDLLILAAKCGVVSQELTSRMQDYLAFRHFFAHAYAFDIDPQRLEPLVRQLGNVDSDLRRELSELTESDAKM